MALLERVAGLKQMWQLAQMQCMEDGGVAPDTKTLNCVLAALHAGEQPDLVLSLVQHMKLVRVVIAFPSTCTTVVCCCQQCAVLPPSIVCLAGGCGVSSAAGPANHRGLHFDGAIHDDFHALGPCLNFVQRGTSLPDATTYRTAVDAMVASGNYAAAAAVCRDAHDVGTFCHYAPLPPPPNAQGAAETFRF